jgi:lipase maturation factor 1
VGTLSSPQAKYEQGQRPTYNHTRSIFLRGLGITYMAAFASMAVQVDGLIGSHGILPVADFLDRARRALGTGPATYWRLPTLLWLDSSDRALHALCWSGFLLAAALFAGFLPGLCTLLLWLFYLAIVVAGQVFLGFQWDSLLLEAGLLAMLMAPWRARLSRATDQPWWFAIWLVRWLVFRLMFQSGAVKLTSHDPTWWHMSALDFHYQTQPLPVWTSWYVHQMPGWFHRVSVAYMFYAELLAPFFIFGPRPIRLVGFTSMALLQLLIAGTGNYGFFNLLAIVLCLTLLDDADWGWLGRSVIRRRMPAKTDAEDDPKATGAGGAWPIARRVAAGAAGMVILEVTTAKMLERIWPGALPGAIVDLDQYVHPLRSTNSYGLFAVMTTERPEITLEGSEDGTNWKPYQFRWKPGELNRRPGFTTPHMPRLDWQLWIAALAGDCRSEPWFLRFEQKLLEGSAEVLSLLGENPFPARPPRYVRARLEAYTFTRWGSRDWWAQEDQGGFCPPIELRSFDRAD